MPDINGQVVITGVAIAYHTKLEVSPHHEKGRIGPPLLVQAEDIPDALREQMVALAQEHAAKYWSEKEQ